MSIVKRYVVGFAFGIGEREDISHVLLIRKVKPKWQKGTLNGIGGKLEDLETPTQAMVREFREETGILTQPMQWEQFCELSGAEVYVEGLEGTTFTLYFFKAFMSVAVLKLARAETIAEGAEEPVLVNLDNLWMWAAKDGVKTVPNVRWLVPMALSSMLGESAKGFSMTEWGVRPEWKISNVHADHGRGGPDGPDDSDCPCRGTVNQLVCGQSGCGFCKT